MKDLNINVMRIDTDADLRSVLARLGHTLRMEVDFYSQLYQAMRTGYDGKPLKGLFLYLDGTTNTCEPSVSAFGRSCE